MQIKRKIDLKEYILNLLRKYWLFFVAFIGMAIYLKIHGSMTDYSGDATSIWETIKSFYSGNIVPSYVLYKGFASVYPYVWLYQLSQIFNVGEFFFVKLFHCFLFAYIATVGFPYLVENMLNIKLKIWRKALLTMVFFWLWLPSHALFQIMVDLPSLAYFILLVNSALKIGNGELRLPIIRYIYTGLLLGINISISGQYTPAALCILLYIIIKTVAVKKIGEKNSHWKKINIITIMLICMVLVKGYNIYFEKTVTDVLRNMGGWIPTSDTWFKLALIGNLDDLRRFVGPNLSDYRGLAIINDFYGEQARNILDSIDSGMAQITLGQYIQLFWKYPIDFITRYANRLFLAVSPDGGYLSISRLFASYTMLFIALASFGKRLKTIKKFFSAKLLIILSFVLSLCAMMITAIEYRYTMQIQGLIFSVALLDNKLWDGLKAFLQSIKQCLKAHFLRNLGQKQFPYLFLIYLLFMLFCFTHIATLYETLGNTDGILFRF